MLILVENVFMWANRFIKNIVVKETLSNFYNASLS